MAGSLILVLLFRVYSDWAYFLFSIGFSLLLCGKIFVDKYILRDETEPVGSSTEGSTYKSMA